MIQDLPSRPLWPVQVPGLDAELLPGLSSAQRHHAEVEQLPHVDQLIDETRGARIFTKLDLAMSYMQFRIRTADRYKTTFRVLCCQ